MITDEDRETWSDLARRIYAAWISYRMGNRGVDYSLKKYAPDDKPIGDLWIEIAKKVNEYASEVTNQNLYGQQEQP
jgi:hypothetical protein